jgi:hypothetical protein
MALPLPVNENASTGGDPGRGAKQQQKQAIGEGQYSMASTPCRLEGTHRAALACLVGLAIGLGVYAPALGGAL